jgi:CDP-diacylglycerol--glycerol-3-phosphate 3-phosphatidyltransferase
VKGPVTPSKTFTLLPHSLPRRFTDPLGLAVARTGLTPNALTALGLAGSLGAAALVAGGYFLIGGLVVLAAAALDLLDGALARATGRVTAFGGVFDSVLDRLGEAAVLGGVLYHFSEGGHRQEVVLAFIAVVGSIMVSYVRARAEGAGLKLTEGLFTRPERVIVLGLGLIVDQMRIALWILAVLTVFTVLQRLYVVWRGLEAQRPRASQQGDDRL